MRGRGSRRAKGLLCGLAVMGLLIGAVGIGSAQEPIKIGAFFALSGPAAPIGTPTKLVAQMVVDKIGRASCRERV